MYCKFCGKPNDNGAQFCNNCGKPLQEEKKSKTPIIIGAIAAIIIVVCVVIGFNLMNSDNSKKEDSATVSTVNEIKEKNDIEKEVEETQNKKEEAIEEQIKQEEEEKKKQEEEEKKKNTIVVDQPTSFNGYDFNIPFYGASNNNMDAPTLIKSFFEMKGASLAQSVLADELGCTKNRASAESMAAVLNNYIQYYGIQARYDVTHFGSESEFYGNADWVFSIVQTNVNDGYPTFFEVNPAYLYGGDKNQGYRYVLVKGYEVSNGGITKLLIDDPIQGQGKIVSLESFEQAVTKKSNILYIH